MIFYFFLTLKPIHNNYSRKKKNTKCEVKKIIPPPSRLIAYSNTAYSWPYALFVFPKQIATTFVPYCATYLVKSPGFISTP